jgi:hypothetical protein
MPEFIYHFFSFYSGENLFRDTNRVMITYDNIELILSQNTLTNLAPTQPIGLIKIQMKQNRL